MAVECDDNIDDGDSPMMTILMYGRGLDLVDVVLYVFLTKLLVR